MLVKTFFDWKLLLNPLLTFHWQNLERRTRLASEEEEEEMSERLAIIMFMLCKPFPLCSWLSSSLLTLLSWLWKRGKYKIYQLIYSRSINACMRGMISHQNKLFCRPSHLERLSSQLVYWIFLTLPFLQHSTITGRPRLMALAPHLSK